MTEDEKLGEELFEAWADNDEEMGEAEFLVVCAELGIDPDDGWEYLSAYFEYTDTLDFDEE